MEPDLDDTGMQWPPGVAKHKRVRLEIHDSLRFDDDRSSAVTDKAIERSESRENA